MIIFSGAIHVVFAVFLYISMFGFDLLEVFIVTFGALFPDIDTPYSRLGRYNIFARLMKHRGITHTLIGMGVFSVLSYVVLGEFVKGFMFGYFTHLFMDSLTPMGIMWLYPYKRRYYSLWKRRRPL